ncbi:hypothetical protein QM480_08990 [Flectobacillus sp. DC10W]|uniref:Uncharacterized protein n=1 Tax=Flectobacillus longus TaxID=2984207 RepID=A0ABT6YLX6_9BACT|nr:hypothetical protein [Flectobacillus longus]MDI9864459.1 hypothetical protein [Flectobacillus longus]
MKRNINLRNYLLGSSKPSFLNGFLFFWGAIENPYEKTMEHYASSSVNESLYNDWLTVGNDLKHSIEKHKQLIAEHEK